MSDLVARSGSGDGQQQQHSISTNFTDIGLEQLRRELQAFAAQREWEQYHTPRNLLLALVGEVGELSEIFQWRGEVRCENRLRFPPSQGSTELRWPPPGRPSAAGAPWATGLLSCGAGPRRAGAV